MTKLDSIVGFLTSCALCQHCKS